MPGVEIRESDGPLAHFGVLLCCVLKPACAGKLPLALASLLWLSMRYDSPEQQPSAHAHVELFFPLTVRTLQTSTLPMQLRSS